MTQPSLSQKTTRWTVMGLLALAVIPMLGGALRLLEIARNAPLVPENSRFLTDPWPAIVHIIAASLFAIGGPFQFAPGLRKGPSSWHRKAGGWLAALGLIAGLSGLWLTFAYPQAPGDSIHIFWLRIVFGSAMVLSVVRSLFAIRERNFTLHGAWMMRAYAIGMGAGTQVFTHIPRAIFIDHPGELSRAFAMGAGWVINVLIVEWILARKRTQKAAETKARLTAFGAQDPPGGLEQRIASPARAVGE